MQHFVNHIVRTYSGEQLTADPMLQNVQGRIHAAPLQTRRAVDNLVVELRTASVSLFDGLEPPSELGEHFLSREDVRASLNMARVQLTNAEIESVIDLFDPNGHDLVDYFELNGVLREHCAELTSRLRGITDDLTLEQLSNEQLQYMLMVIGDEPCTLQDPPSKAEHSSWAACKAREIRQLLWSKPAARSATTRTRVHLCKLVKRKIASLQKQEVLQCGVVQWEPDSDDPNEALACLRVGALFLSYECPYWWFEVVEMLRKLLLISILSVVSEGADSYLWASFIVSFAAQAFFSAYKPFAEPQLDHLQMSSLLVTCLTMCGLLEPCSSRGISVLIYTPVLALNLACCRFYGIMLRNSVSAIDASPTESTLQVPGHLWTD